jgi:hypothetical protein
MMVYPMNIRAACPRMSPQQCNTPYCFIPRQKIEK